MILLCTERLLEWGSGTPEQLANWPKVEEFGVADESPRDKPNDSAALESS